MEFNMTLLPLWSKLYSRHVEVSTNDHMIRSMWMFVNNLLANDKTHHTLILANKTRYHKFVAIFYIVIIVAVKYLTKVKFVWKE